MFARLAAPTLLLLANCASASSAPIDDARPATAMSEWAATCEDWDEWDKPGPPFKIAGNTYYVGTCGIASLLIATDDGLALIDSGTEAGADIVLANIRALGFNPRDVKLLLASHEHFDHVGGMAKLEAATGAVVVSSKIGIDVVASGKANPDDPQAGMHDAMRPISQGMPYFWGDAPYRIDYFGLTPMETPGHTPGAMSWHWQSCEGEDCQTIVYADSLSPVSRDGYRFSDHPQYLDAYRASLAQIAGLDCDILLTPHPSASGMRDKLLAGDLASGMTCAEYARAVGERLDERLAKEADGG